VIAAIFRFFERLHLRLWAWRLRRVRCVHCDGGFDRIELTRDGDYAVIAIRAHCAVCLRHTEWRRDSAV